ncbi:MAG: hypothetical protein E7108_01875 [Bacteroidales bacterium]|jgi:hypothetical protein|nr:hypothetical protein [Bacteroidales bacterium]
MASYEDIHNDFDKMLETEQSLYLDRAGQAMNIKPKFLDGKRNGALTDEQYSKISNQLKDLAFYRTSRDIRTIRNILYFFLFLSIISIILTVLYIVLD